MTNLLRISDAASLALHAMARLSRADGGVVSIHEIASELDISENHLSKVCQRLAHAGLVEAIRGPKGGFRLAKDAGAIRLLEVYETIDGPIPESGCLLGRPACAKEKCVLGGLLDLVNREVRQYLAGTTLADLACRQQS